MIAQCWLHIGTEKTGSTSIQSFLAQNRGSLPAQGVLYPETAGIRAHHKLVAFSADDDRDDDTRRSLGVMGGTSLDGFRNQLTASLEGEAAARGATTLVLSNERLATLLTRPSEVARLKHLCDKLACRTRVVVYVRNQVDFLVSRYTNVIREGGTGEFEFRARPVIGDYAILLDRWSEVFGKGNLIVRRFEPGEFPEGNVVADFSRVIGLLTKGLQTRARANPSLDAASLAFLRALNRKLPRTLENQVHPYRGVVVRVLQRRRGGQRFTIPRPLANRIEDAYRNSNERVSDEYFGARYEPLFSPPVLVSDSPAPDSMSVASATRIGGYLAMGLVREGITWAANRLCRRA